MAVQSHEQLINEDTGCFWLTNQRFGFEGNRKSIVIKYDKVLRFELTPNGLVITKEGRESPYLLGLDDYEVPAAILSHILNRS